MDLINIFCHSFTKYADDYTDCQPQWEQVYRSMCCGWAST